MDPLGGDTYQVTYAINLQDNATRGINSFTSAVNKLNTASTQLQEFANKFNKITTGFNKAFELRVNVGNAMKNLDRVEKKLLRIRELATGVGLKVGGSVVGTSGSSGGGGGAAIVQKPSGRQSSKPTGRPLVAPKSGKPIIPNNIGYRILGPSMIDSGGIGILDMFKGMGVMYGISAVGSAMREVIGQSVEYQNVMQTAKNILKANYKGGNFNTAFGNVERIARDVGVETKFTAVEVADAVKFLAMAGLDLDAISKSIRPIADIALIGDSDLGQTADVMTNIMTAYGIRPDKMRTTADVMTRTFTMSNTTLMEMAESFKYAAPLLSLNNVPFETAAAMIGILGDAGVKGSQAGTTIRTIMNNLMNPTKKQKDEWARLGIKTRDDSGNLRGLNEIFADLNTAREAGMGVDIYKLFRLTATSGAGALMTHVEKWNKIIEENFLSQGLSEKLANEKKNTVAGLWAQLKSAFIEGGLKVFEDNDSNIRNYLRRGISWLKSDEFDKAIRGAVDTVASMGSTLLDFTKIVFKFYEKFKPVVDLWLRFQLYAKGVLTILRSMKGVWNILAGFTSSFIAPFTAQTSTPMVTPAIAGYGGYYSTTLGVGGVQPKPNFWQRMAGNPRFAKYGPLSSMAGMGLGYAIGNGFDNESGGMWGALIGGGLGALAPMLISGPWGWAAAAAIVGITAIASAFSEHNRKVREATAAYNEYRQSLFYLGIEKVNVNDTEDVIQANLRITTSLLHNENEKLELQAKLWRQIIDAKNELEQKEDVDNPFLGSRTYLAFEKWIKDFGKLEDKNLSGLWINDLNKFVDLGLLQFRGYGQKADTDLVGGYKLNEAQYELKDALTGAHFTYTGFFGNPLQGNIGYSSSKINEFFALSHALASDNPIYDSMRSELFTNLGSARSLSEFDYFMNKFLEDHTIKADWSKNINDLSIDDVKKISTTKEFYTYPAANAPYMMMVGKIYESFLPWRSYYESLDNYVANGVIIPAQEFQNHLFNTTSYGLMKDVEGVFGTPEWIANANKYIANNFGARSQVESVIDNIYNYILREFDKAPVEQKDFYARFLDKSYWEQLQFVDKGTKEIWHPDMSKYNGFIEPQQGQESTTYPAGYRWDAKRGLWINTQNNNWAIPGFYNSAILPTGNTTPTEDDGDYDDYISQSIPPLQSTKIMLSDGDGITPIVADNSVPPVVNIYVESIMKSDSMTVEDNMDDFMGKFKQAFDAVLNEATIISGGTYKTGYA